MKAERNIPIFKTPCQTEREERDMAIYNEYQQMTSVEGQSKTLVTEFLMKKYGIHSQGTIYVIRQRVEKRLQAQRKEAALWAKYGADGTDGDKGDKGDTGETGDYTELRFAKNGSTTTPPALSNLLANPTGWSTSTPTVGIAEYLWMTSAKKSSKGILKTVWTTPVRISGRNGTNGKDGNDGADGKSPAMVFRGDYSHTATYYGTSYRLDCVRYNGAYSETCRITSR